MTDEQLRIRGYLTAQAAKLRPAEIIDKVRAAMDQLRADTAAVPAAQFDDRPAPDEWSANHVMAHVVEAGRHFGGAIVRMIEGQPPGTPRDAPPREAPSRTPDDWWAILERERAALFERVRAANPAARLEATIEHPFFGPLNWRETLLFMRIHDLDHAGQMQKIAAALAASRPA
jgi:uncharacterized damage-inducible protein DinB